MKKKLLFKGPVLTASGYGVHSRQLLTALIDCGAFDISVMGLTWGQTPFLVGQGPEIDQIVELMRKRDIEAPNNPQYDVSVQVTIPNEFEKLAKVNIGVTAGIEVDRVSPEWIIKANDNVDLIVVPSKHSAQTYAGAQYSDQQGNIIRLQKPVMIAPEGVDTEIFHPGDPEGPQIDLKLESKFNFLSVGLGLEKGFGEDRKNISTLVKWFCERFKDDPDVGLVLKVSMVGYSLLDFEAVKNRVSEIKKMAGCEKFPRIQIIHGRLSDQQLANLYRHPHVKAYVSLTHGEGFGLPIIEAAACGLPVLATNWSGHLDFLSIGDVKRFVPIDFDLIEIPGSSHWKGVMEPGSRWANPKEEDAKSKMRKVSLSYDKPKEWATELAGHIQKTFDVRKTNYDFCSGLMRFLAAVNSQPQGPEDLVKKVREQLKLDGVKSLLYTMPMSAGDVFISTAVVDALKKKHPDHLIFFATGEQYMDILKGNPDVHQVIRWERWMADVPLLEKMFDEVYTPNLAIQTVSANWIRGGKGRLLANEMAAQCQVELGDYKVSLDLVDTPCAGGYIVLHPGSGRGQWEARNYLHWQEVVNNLVSLTGLSVVQVGAADDPLYEGVIDYRGKTSYNQLATLIKDASCLVGIDTVSMHMAAALGTSHVTIFGSSFATSTGPVCKSDVQSVLLDTKNRYTCDKACYKYQCSVDKDHPCLNEISPREIVQSVLKIVNEAAPPERRADRMSEYKEHRPRIAGYTHVLNAKSQGFPYKESITSMLGFCDSVVVVDGGSTDGTLEVLRDLEALTEGKVKVFQHAWDWSVPGMDGEQKAFGRAMCEGDFLWQQDADEVVHEEDYEKIRKLVKRFPKDVDLLDLPVVELWGKDGQVRTDRHSWKWRLSRSNFKITHGINKDARVFDEKTGKTFAKKGMSDGCEYVDIMTGEYIQHRGFYTAQLEQLRQQDLEQYGREMNRIFKELPSVFHYSWSDLPRKIRSFKQFWNKCWSNLYNDPAPVDRFPDVDIDRPETVEGKAAELLARGGEHGAAPTFKLERSQPPVMAR